jgi:type IV secretory pathway VirD2 relaxase
MAGMERDLHTKLEWIAVDHWDTDNPHTHVVLRGKDDLGKDPVIARDYITEGMRHRASEVATLWLGPRTELDIQASLRRETSARSVGPASTGSCRAWSRTAPSTSPDPTPASNS